MATHQSAASPTTLLKPKKSIRTWLKFGEKTIYSWSEVGRTLAVVPVMIFNACKAIEFCRYYYESLEMTSSFDKGKVIVGIMCALWAPLRIYYAVDIILILWQREKQKLQNQDDKEQCEEKNDEKYGQRIVVGGE